MGVGLAFRLPGSHRLGRYDRQVTQPPEPARTVRDRTHERTRAALIDAAVGLCLRRGYDNTTVEHAAAADDVSARTFSRYFPNEAAVVTTVRDVLADEVARQLRSLVSDLGPPGIHARRSLRGSHPRPHHLVSSIVGRRHRRIISVVTASPTLRQAAIDYRGPQVLEAMAERMNVAVGDPRLDLAMTLISVHRSACVGRTGRIRGSAPVAAGGRATRSDLRRSCHLRRRSRGDRASEPWQSGMRRPVASASTGGSPDGRRIALGGAAHTTTHGAQPGVESGGRARNALVGG